MLSSSKLIRIFELEYKLNKIYSSSSLRPSSLKMAEKYEAELAVLISDAINDMKELFQWWINYHKDAVVDPVDIYNEAKKYIPLDEDEYDDAYYDWMSSGGGRYGDIFSGTEIKLKQSKWKDGHLRNIVDMRDKLAKYKPSKYSSGIGLFNESLSTMHGGGPMLNHLVDKTNIDIGLLDELNAPDNKFQQKWDKEISKFSENTLNVFKKISIRVNADIERSQQGVGVSTSARKYMRKFYENRGVMSIAFMRNDKINSMIAYDFIEAQPLHRFRLKDGTVAEIRKSKGGFFYIAAFRNGAYDVLSIQSHMKDVPERVRNYRLRQEYLGEKQ